MTDRDLLRAAVAEQTVGLAAEAAALSEADLRAPSGLPGWSRGHVLAHVRLNAEAFLGVLRSAAAGEVGRMYPGRRERDADIEAAAGDPPARHLEALLATADALATAWAALPVERYDVGFTAPAGWSRPVGIVDFFRWREVVLHRIDLHPVGEAPRTAADVLAGSPAAVVERLLDETCTAFAGRDDVPPLRVTATDLDRRWDVRTTTAGADAATEVSGTAAALSAWLTGRGDGAGVTSSGPLPALPPFA